MKWDKKDEIHKQFTILHNKDINVYKFSGLHGGCCSNDNLLIIIGKLVILFGIIIITPTRITTLLCHSRGSDKCWSDWENKVNYVWRFQGLWPNRAAATKETIDLERSQQELWVWTQTTRETNSPFQLYSEKCESSVWHYICNASFVLYGLGDEKWRWSYPCGHQSLGPTGAHMKTTYHNNIYLHSVYPSAWGYLPINPHVVTEVPLLPFNTHITDLLSY